MCGLLELGPGPQHVAVEFFDVGRWLTHGDFALEVPMDNLVAVEHRLIPARVHSELARLKAKGLASIWARGRIPLVLVVLV